MFNHPARDHLPSAWHLGRLAAPVPKALRIGVPAVEMSGIVSV